MRVEVENTCANRKRLHIDDALRSSSLEYGQSIVGQGPAHIRREACACDLSGNNKSSLRLPLGNCLSCLDKLDQVRAPPDIGGTRLHGYEDHVGHFDGIYRQGLIF